MHPEEDTFDKLERAEKLLEELEHIRKEVPHPHSPRSEQAYFGLGKAIITAQRHVAHLQDVASGKIR